jgi:hypothetical protein
VAREKISVRADRDGIAAGQNINIGLNEERVIALLEARGVLQATEPIPRLLTYLKWTPNFGQADKLRSASESNHNAEVVSHAKETKSPQSGV